MEAELLRLYRYVGAERTRWAIREGFGRVEHLRARARIRRMCAKGVSLDAVGGAEWTRWDGFGMARDEEEGEDDQEEGQEEGRRCWRRKA